MQTPELRARCARQLTMPDAFYKAMPHLLHRLYVMADPTVAAYMCDREPLSKIVWCKKAEGKHHALPR
jgi:hypothetical protein